jgi:hypothetical protein
MRERRVGAVLVTEGDCELAGNLFDIGQQRAVAAAFGTEPVPVFCWPRVVTGSDTSRSPPSAGPEIEWTLRLAAADNAVPSLLAVSVRDDRALL